MMRPFAEFPLAERRRVRFVLCDIDDTITSNGRLQAAAYAALERLQRAGLLVVPITGRPGGWCDMIARFWPVDAVVGENGAFYMRYDRTARKMLRRFWQDEAARAESRARLADLRQQILREVPGAGIASDQPYRECDLAVDYCEDVPPLGKDAVAKIVALFEAAGAQAKVSSIHVNGWFGDWDKLSMTRRLFAEQFEIDLDVARAEAVFAGDSPNDQPMFAFFPNAVGVANIRRFEADLRHRPAWVTEREAGAGFVELADALVQVV